MYALTSSLLVVGLALAASPVPAQQAVRLGPPEIAEPLARRGFLGVMVRELEEEPGVRVLEVVAGGTAQRAGLLAEDVILAVDGEPVADVGGFVSRVGGRPAGGAIELRYRRAGEERTISTPVAAFPTEIFEHSEVTLGTVAVEGARLRTIVTRPRPAAEEAAGPRPAVLFIQGLGCSSVERPFASGSDPWLNLVDAAGAAGFVTLRVEKSGLGDSAGPPCSEIDFTTELAGYRAGLEALGRLDGVDPDEIFLFGHSMGGVMAPLLAASDGGSAPVAGVAVYGTILKSFFEYLIENRRRQLPRDGFGPADDHRAMTGYAELFARVLFDRETPAEIWAEHPHLEDAVEQADATHLYGRHAAFFHQLQRIDLPAAWQQVAVPVLALHGEYDWVSSRPDHERIAELAGERGRHVELAGLDHAMTAHATLEESYRRYPDGDLTGAVARVFLGWVEEVLAGGTG